MKNSNKYQFVDKYKQHITRPFDSRRAILVMSIVIIFVILTIVGYARIAPERDFRIYMGGLMAAMGLSALVWVLWTVFRMFKDKRR